MTFDPLRHFLRQSERSKNLYLYDRERKHVIIIFEFVSVCRIVHNEWFQQFVSFTSVEFCVGRFHEIRQDNTFETQKKLFIHVKKIQNFFILQIQDRNLHTEFR